MNTEDTIKEIKRQWEYAEYAVLRPMENYDGVNWTVVSLKLGTIKINGYQQPNKIVVEK